MNSLFDNRMFRALVFWCGAWQLCHLLLNINTAFFGATDFPPPPPQGWTPQTRLIFDGMVAADIIQAALCLVFVGAYVARRGWCFMLGLVCLGSSAFNSFAFTYFVVGTGAWSSHAKEYWMIQLLWAPLFALFLWLCKGMSQVGTEEAGRRAPAPSTSASAFGNA